MDRSIADVAAHAGVSPATVSRVINGGAPVKSSTRARVLRAMQELRYYPNQFARSLAGRAGFTIGVIVSNLDNPFFLDIYRTIEADAHRSGCEVLLANTGYRPEQLAADVRLMLGRRVSGLAVIVSETAPEIRQELALAGVPTVFYDVGEQSKQTSVIRMDYRRGMRQIVEYLHSLGHRRMAYLSHPGRLQATEDRRLTFLETTERLGIATQLLAATTDGFAGGRDAARELLRATDFAPTAIVCYNDVTAIGVLRELADRGLSVPGDISVTGFDNISLAEFVTPQLTTVDVPRERIGHLFFTQLNPSSGDVPPAGREIIVDPHLIVRQSTGPARG